MSSVVIAFSNFPRIGRRSEYSGEGVSIFIAALLCAPCLSRWPFVFFRIRSMNSLGFRQDL